jgi:hypothetical protein
VLRTNDYFSARDDLPKLDWEAMLLPGIVLGSWLSSRGAGTHRSGVPPRWKQRFGARPHVRLAGAIIGGAMMMYGARMAKGCTSGHGIGGASQLAASSWLFIPIFFASAIAVARALFGERGGR